MENALVVTEKSDSPERITRRASRAELTVRILLRGSKVRLFPVRLWLFGPLQFRDSVAELSSSRLDSSAQSLPPTAERGRPGLLPELFFSHRL